MKRKEMNRMKNKEEMAVQLPNGVHLAVQTCEDGYDYTFYDKEYKDLDGGILEEGNDIVEVVKSLIAEEYEFALADCKLEDYDRQMQQVEEAENF